LILSNRDVRNEKLELRAKRREIRKELLEMGGEV